MQFTEWILVKQNIRYRHRSHCNTHYIIFSRHYISKKYYYIIYSYKHWLRKRWVNCLVAGAWHFLPCMQLYTPQPFGNRSAPRTIAVVIYGDEKGGLHSAQRNSHICRVLTCTMCTHMQSSIV